MTIMYVLLMLAGAPAAEPAEAPDPPKIKLICHYETTIYPFISGRKLCLTASEWEERAKGRGQASRTMLHQYLGNTNCMSDGICTDF